MKKTDHGAQRAKKLVLKRQILRELASSDLGRVQAGQAETECDGRPRPTVCMNPIYSA